MPDDIFSIYNVLLEMLTYKKLLGMYLFIEDIVYPIGGFPTV